MISLADIALLFAALGFAGMGLVAIATPTRVTRQFDIPVLSAAGRNEVRAVYGGFGVVMCGMLLTALLSAELRAGICLTVAAALLGMAGGRVVSGAMDRTLGRFPLTYLVIEVFGAALLIYAA